MAENSVAPKSYRPDLKKLRENALSAGGSDFWKPAVGVNRFRILPSWDPNNTTGPFLAEQALHYGFRQEGHDKSLPCLATMWGEPCPACILQAWLAKNAPKEVARDMRAQVRVYYNIVVRPSNEMKVWGCGEGMREKIFAFLEMPEYADALDPDTGRDWMMTREGTTKYDTRYPTFNPSPNTSPAGVVGWQSLAKNLQQELVDSQRVSNEDMLKIIYGTYAAQYPLDEILA